jgi:hypothetical protein
MSFKPRHLSDGRICCSNPSALCPRCAAATGRRALVRTEDAYAAASPNPYALSRELADATAPDVDPAYEPYGKPANGYAIHLALRALAREDAQDTTTTTPSARALLTNGVPDGYRTALDARTRS